MKTEPVVFHSKLRMVYTVAMRGRKSVKYRCFDQMFQISWAGFVHAFVSAGENCQNPYFSTT